MDAKSVVAILQSHYPNRPVIQLPVNNPTEIICEVTQDAQSSTAIAVIDHSIPHHHNHIVETYTVLQGQLCLNIDGVEHLLSEGNSFIIHPQQVHWAQGGAWIKVVCIPPWTPEDHILEETNN